MKTLLERLKPEYLELLNKDEEKYPYLIKIIKKYLSEHCFITEMNIVISFQFCTLLNVPFEITEINNLFIEPQ